jgi:hypothetical protein
MAEAATFSRESLTAYEKQPQKQVADTANPFAGATPAKAADPAAIAAAKAEAEALENNAELDVSGSGDEVDPSGDASNSDDQTASGDGGTSDDNADSSTASADPGDETGTSDVEADGEDASATSRRPPPKKGSAAERLQEVLALRNEERDLMEGYKEYGKMRDKQLQEVQARLAQLEQGGARPAAATTAQPTAAVDTDPMPDLTDPEINFDTDKLRVRTAAWTRRQADAAARAAVEQVTGQNVRKQLETEVNTKVETFAATKPDFDTKVRNNQILLDNQLSPDASFAVAKSEFTGDLLYYFGTNTKEAIRLAKLDPVSQVAEVNRLIGRMEARKEAATATTKTTATGAKPVVKKSITQAPPPPQPTRAAGRANERDETDSGMSMDEFANQHRAKKNQARTNARKMRGLN